MARDRRDHYYWKAKDEGYRSRAAFKLLQINDKFHIINEKSTVVDLGAAPGGWLEVVRDLTTKDVVGVDLRLIKPIRGVTTIKGDITSDTTIEKIIEIIGESGADTVICDAAPNLSGNWSLDHARSIDLAASALECAKKILRPNGNFVVKVFHGDMFKEYLEEVKLNFSYVRSHSPKASRSESAEMYIVGKKYLTAPLHKGDEFDVEIKQLGSNGDGAVLVDSFVVFVKNVEVGDKVRIKIKDVKPSFAFADVVEVLNSNGGDNS
jgi:23S rRNA (uridine2552-2'-O)-methyltransferase